MSSSLRARMARLEATIPTQFDPAGEAAEHGDLVWNMNGHRCYNQQTADGLRVAVTGTRGPLVYEIVGVSMAALT